MVLGAVFLAIKTYEYVDIASARGFQRKPIRFSPSITC